MLNIQLADFSTDVGGTADSNALYAVWGGGNDFLQSLDPVVAANNILQLVNDLSVRGAQDIIVANLPVADLGFAVPFNTTLLTGLADITGANIFVLDVIALNQAILGDPAAFGFTNAADPCFDTAPATPTQCSNPDEYLLWDTVHPTTAAHDLIGAEALATVPEPGTGPPPGPTCAGWRSASERRRADRLR
jgi:phospholipase/lecithinase/hemolysin